MNRRSFIKALTALPVVGVCFKSLAGPVVGPVVETPVKSKTYIPLDGSICPICRSSDVDIDNNGIFTCNCCKGQGEFRVCGKINYYNPAETILKVEFRAFK